MDDGKFFGDLRGTPYTASTRHASGALRIEFGQITLGTTINTGVVSSNVRTTMWNGIAAVATPTTVPTPANTTSGGMWTVVAGTPYSSGYLDIKGYATMNYSGTLNNATINYMVIGY